MACENAWQLMFKLHLNQSRNIIVKSIMGLFMYNPYLLPVGVVIMVLVGDHAADTDCN